MVSLHTASTLEEVDILLSGGADVDEKNDYGDKPFYTACSGGNMEVVTALYNHCSGIESTSWCEGRQMRLSSHSSFSINMTPIDIAARNGHYYVVEFLISRGFNYQNVLSLAGMNGSMDIINLLFQLETPPDINGGFAEDSDVTPLNIACFHAQLDVVNILLNKGAVVNRYSLYLACLKFYCTDDYVLRSIIAALVTQGANVNELCPIKAQELVGTSISHIVAFGNRFKSLEFLIDVGADVNVACLSGRTILMGACRGSSEIGLIEKIIKSGANINAVDDNGRTALFLECQHSKPNIQIIKMLIDSGADVNVETNSGFFPITAFCENYSTPNLEVIKLLIDNGADVNARNNIGYTLAEVISQRLHNINSIRLLRMLIENGADTNHF